MSDKMSNSTCTSKGEVKPAPLENKQPHLKSSARTIENDLTWEERSLLLGPLKRVLMSKTK